MEVVCNHCKKRISSCNKCNSGEISHDVTSNLIFLAVSLIICMISAYRWQGAIDDYEGAQRLKTAFMKKRGISAPALPFKK